MKPFGDLFGDQGGVASGAVIDDQVDSTLPLEPFGLPIQRLFLNPLIYGRDFAKI